LERQLQVAQEDSSIDVIGSAIAYIKNSDKKLLVKRVYPPDPRRAFNKYTAIAHPTILLRRDVFERYGYYNESEDVRYSPDHEMWCRFLVQGAKLYNVPDVLVNYYQSADNGRNRNAKKTLRSVVRLKMQYAKSLRFDSTDYVYLWLERILTLVP